MSILRKTIVATALLGAGLGATTGAAFATDGGGHESMNLKHDEHSGNASGVTKACSNPQALGQHGQDQSGLANASDVQTTVPLNACNNDIPVNVLGVQVPVQDASANVPVGSPTNGDDDSDGGNGNGNGNDGGILGGL